MGWGGVGWGGVGRVIVDSEGGVLLLLLTNC